MYLGHGWGVHVANIRGNANGSDQVIEGQLADAGVHLPGHGGSKLSWQLRPHTSQQGELTFMSRDKCWPIPPAAPRMATLRPAAAAAAALNERAACVRAGSRLRIAGDDELDNMVNGLDSEEEQRSSLQRKGSSRSPPRVCSNVLLKT